MTTDSSISSSGAADAADDALAGEYVLGTLSAGARAAFEARLPHDAALREAVRAWEARLLPLASLAPPAEPSPELWPRIERSVDSASAAFAASTTSAASAASASGAATSSASSTSPPSALRMKTPAAKLAGWWNSLNLWRGLAAGGFAAAAVMLAVVVTQVAAPRSPQYMVVLVAPQDKSPGWVIQAQAGASRQLSLVPLGAMQVPPHKTLQFWTKGAQWQGPVSLGLVPQGSRTLNIPIDKLPPLEPDQLFELTLEPESGSPIGRPTGPIQYIGRAVKVL